jgi:hypothetical protein
VKNKMGLDNKEFWALKASDVVRVQNNIMKIIDRDINMCRQGKMREKEIEEWEDLPFLDALADWLENLREEIEEELWIDQFGDEPPK